MGEGEKFSSQFSPSAFSLFRFHLSPFPAEPPDTQATGKGVGPAENASSFFAAVCDSRKTLEKMAQPSHPCLKPGLHNRQIFFLSFPSSRLGCLALARAPKPV